jgi:hypothetical protein
MTRTSPKPSLFRDPADWARDHGWVSRRRAINASRKLEGIADILDGDLPRSVDDREWAARELRKIAAKIAPRTTPAQRNPQPSSTE